MKKLFVLSFSFFSLWMLPASADGLTNSLNSLMSTKDKRSTINLGNIDLNAKSRPPRNGIKKRSGNTIIATVDGYKIRKKEADAFLEKATKGKVKDYDMLAKKQRKIVISDLVRINKFKYFKSRPAIAVIATVNGIDVLKKDADMFLEQVTRGKAKDFDRLDEKQRMLLVQDIARPIVINNAIDTNVSEEEKDAIFKQMWVEKQMKIVTVSNKEMVAFYEETKKKALAKNPQAVIPTYMSLGTQIKSQVLEQKIISRLMKDVKIEIYEDAIEVKKELQ